jgi:hypothetical protein
MLLTGDCCSVLQIINVNSFFIVLCRKGIPHSHPCVFQLYNDGPIVQVLPTRPVAFSRKILPDTDAHHPSSGSGLFTAPRTGLYWFHFETYTDGEGRANYSLTDGYSNERLTQLSSNCPNFNLPTLSRDDLRSLNETDQLYTTSTYASRTLPSDTYTIAWSGFEMTELLGAMPVAFSVVNSSLRSLEERQWTHFSTVLVNTYCSWNMTSSAFVAPIDGVYVLSVSTTVSISNKWTAVTLLLETQSIRQLKQISCFTRLNFHCTATVSFTVITQLNQSQYVRVHNRQYDSNIDYSWDSFKGFLYAPLTAQHNVIWSLDAQPTDAHIEFSSDEDYVQLALSSKLTSSPIPFTSFNTTHLFIPAGGIYYVTLTAQFCARPLHCCTVGLYANDDVMLFKTTPFARHSEECFSHNRAMLLPLQQNDTFTIRLLEGIPTKVTNHNWIDFSGFLVHARW